MAIQIGDTVPTGHFKVKTADGIIDMSSSDLFSGRKVVVFSLPGAFTPVCSARHLPGYVENAAKLKAKGVDTVACLSVNDPFVMAAWGKDQKVGDSVTLLADSDAAYTKAMGMDKDYGAIGLGVRGKRFAMVVDNGKVTHLLEEEDPSVLDVSSAEKVLTTL